MKKTIASIALVACALPAISQDTKTQFDNKFRFGLRITPQPTWLVSGKPKNEIPNGAILGFGFGLNLEYMFSHIAALVTGIGCDFEGGKVQYRNDADYRAVYWTDEAGETIKSPGKDAFPAKATAYELKERKIRTTYATIPLILKLSTQEYSGLKYFGMFGGELGYRVNAKSQDTYYQSIKRLNDTSNVYVLTPGGESEVMDIKPQTLFMRVTFNAGAGVEYRLAGSTAVFCSVNYFRNLTNLMNKKEYIMYNTDGGTAKYVQSQLFITGIRINVGFMF